MRVVWYQEIPCEDRRSNGSSSLPVPIPLDSYFPPLCPRGLRTPPTSPPPTWNTEKVHGIRLGRPGRRTDDGMTYILSQDTDETQFFSRQ